jgi:pyruvate dehydrogenase E2 component (dihydrolipoamide acetyltransferase)
MLVKLPNLGEGADSGSVASVLVQVGDQIEKNQTIIEIESEKALVPVPSPVAGKVIAVKTSEGATISVGQPILEVESDGAEAEAPATSADASPAPSLRPAAAPVQIAAAPVDHTFDKNAPIPPASPTVRRIARQIGLDLRRVAATGRGGRVEMTDLQAFIQRLSASPASQADTPAPIVDFSQWGPVRSEPLTELRKIISQRMVSSKRTAPHVTQFDNVDITDLNALRKEHSAAWKEKGAPLTLTVFAIKAVVETLKKHPNFNASLDEQAGQIVFKDYYHIGIAVDTEAGLMVPTLRDADKLSLFEIASSLTELAVKARERKLTKADMQGGTFTISNQGGIGGAHFTPVINLPESAILGIGRGSVQPAVVDGAIEPRLMMPIAISYDHRTIDGGAAARFTVDLAAAFGQFTADDLKL